MTFEEKLEKARELIRSATEELEGVSKHMLYNVEDAIIEAFKILTGKDMLLEEIVIIPQKPKPRMIDYQNKINCPKSKGMSISRKRREKGIFNRGILKGYCQGIDDARKIVRDCLKELRNEWILEKEKEEKKRMEEIKEI